MKYSAFSASFSEYTERDLDDEEIEFLKAYINYIGINKFKKLYANVSSKAKSITGLYGLDNLMNNKNQAQKAGITLLDFKYIINSIIIQSHGKEMLGSVFKRRFKWSIIVY